MFLGIYGIDEYVPIPPVTHRFSSGAAYAPTAITYSIYEEGNTTGLDEDVDMTPASPFDSVTGFYYARRQLTAAAGFESNKTYVVLVKATVDSVAAIESHVFQIRPLQTGDSYAIVNGDHGLVSIQDAIDSLLADVGDASASTLGSLYAILGNAAATIDSRTASGTPGANNGVPTTNGTKINQTVDLTAGQSIACSDKTGFALSATGADLILKGSTFVQAIVAALNEFATYGLTALHTLLVTTGIKTADTAAPADMALNSTVAKDATVAKAADDFNALQKASITAAVPSALSIQSGLSTLTAQQVWEYATRTLSAFGFSVTVGTNNDKTGYTLTVTPPTAADIKAAMEAVGSHLTLTKTAAEAIDTLTKASGSGDLARALVILEKIYTSAATIVEGAAAAGTLSTTEMTTTLTEATDDHYNGRIIIWTSGVLANQATDITDYDGATKKLTYTAVTEAPTAADTFVIV